MMDPVHATTPEVVINTSDLDPIYLYVTNDDYLTYRSAQDRLQAVP